MTGDPKNGREALDRLTDALVEDILAASDEDILADAAAQGSDPAKVADDMRALFGRSLLDAAKTRLAHAKQAVREAHQQGGTVVHIDDKLRRRYDVIVANDAALSAKLTMAARKGEGQSERDIESAIEDLKELGALDEPEDGNT